VDHKPEIGLDEPLACAVTTLDELNEPGAGVASIEKALGLPAGGKPLGQIGLLLAVEEGGGKAREVGVERVGGHAASSCRTSWMAERMVA
jgi:hypothetical protein